MVADQNKFPLKCQMKIAVFGELTDDHHGVLYVPGKYYAKAA